MTLAYIIFGIVMLHLVVGFVWVFYKMTKPNPDKLEMLNNNFYPESEALRDETISKL